MPMKSTPSNFPSELQEPIMWSPEIDWNIDSDTPSTLKLVSCQEDYLNDAQISVNEDQDSCIHFQIFHLGF